MRLYATQIVEQGGEIVAVNLVYSPTLKTLLGEEETTSHLSLIYRYGTLHLHQASPWKRIPTNPQHHEILQQKLRHFHKIILSHNVFYQKAGILFDKSDPFTFHGGLVHMNRPDGEEDCFIRMVRGMRDRFRLAPVAEVEILLTRT